MKATTITKYPKELLSPIEEFLLSQLTYLKVSKKNIKKDDPFRDLSRTVDIALDSKAETQFGHDRSVAISEQLSQKIGQTKKALLRIKKGKYGFCENCGDLINTDRLAIMPEATFCIKCSTLQK